MLLQIAILKEIEKEKIRHQWPTHKPNRHWFICRHILWYCLDLPSITAILYSLVLAIRILTKCMTVFKVYQSIKPIDQFTVTLAEQHSNQRLTENVKGSFPACNNLLFVSVMIKWRLLFVMTQTTDDPLWKWIL